MAKEKVSAVMNLNETVITDISDAVTVKANKGKHIKIKDRRFFGLSFCTSGRITYTHGDKKFISDKDCAIILPMHATYELYNNEGGEFPLINFLCMGDRLTDEFICIPISNVSSYLGDFERIKSLTFSGTNRLASLSILYDILYRLANEEHPQNRLLSPVIKYLNNRFCDEDISNTKLAEIANISEVYLRRLFLEVYSTTPRQYVISMRIERAKQLLIDTNDSINDVALRCGFSSIYHFSRAFKDKLRMTPGEFRKHYYYTGHM